MITPTEIARVGAAIVRVLGDSNRTDEIQVVEEITGRAPLADLLRAWKETGAAGELLRDRPELNRQQVDYDALARLPATTLGGAYARHLRDNNLSVETAAVATRFVEDPDAAYLVRRYRQTHDVWHVLTGLGVAGWQEVALHAFSLGQLYLPHSSLIVLFGGIKHGLLEKRWSVVGGTLPRAFATGRRAAPLMPVVWEKHWDEPLASVRSRFGVGVVS